MRCGSPAPGRGFNKTLWIQLKMVVFAPIPRASVSTAVAVKPGDLTIMRRLKRRSCQSASKNENLCNALRSSCSKVTLPNWRRAAAAASSLDMPCAMNFSASNCKMLLDLVIELTIALVSAQKTPHLRRESAQPELSSCAHDSSSFPVVILVSRSRSSFRFELQHPANHVGNPLPLLCFHLQMFLPALGDRIKLRLAVVLRSSPLGRNPCLLLQPQQRGVHRHLIQLKNVAAHLLDAPRNAEAVQRPQRVQRLQNHQVQRSLQHFRFL